MMAKGKQVEAIARQAQVRRSRLQLRHSTHMWSHGHCGAPCRHYLLQALLFRSSHFSRALNSSKSLIQCMQTRRDAHRGL